MLCSMFLEEAWSQKYQCFFVLLDAKDFGTCSRRQRLWGHCINRKTIIKTFASLQNVIPLFYRPKWLKFTFYDYLIATEDELDQELDWASSRPKSKAKGKSLQTIKALARPFWECLTGNHGCSCMDNGHGFWTRTRAQGIDRNPYNNIIYNNPYHNIIISYL